MGVVFAGVYSLSNQFFPIGFLISEEFMVRVCVRTLNCDAYLMLLLICFVCLFFQSNSFALRLVYMVVCGKVALWRYISVWLIAVSACVCVEYGGVARVGVSEIMA